MFSKKSNNSLKTNMIRIFMLFTSLFILMGIIAFATDYIQQNYDNYYMNEHLGYQYSYHNYSGYQPYIPYNHVYIEIIADDQGNITVDPYTPHNVILDSHALTVQLPTRIAPDGIGLTLPYGWTYEIIHEFTHPYEQEEGRNGNVGSFAPEAGTNIRLFHTWHQNGGPAGIMPLAFGEPAGFTTYTLAPPFGAASWASAFAVPGNIVISVPQSFTMDITVVIPPGRNIILASQGTDLDGNLVNHIPGNETFTLTRTASGGDPRHFDVGAGATLWLSNIILDGGFAYANPIGAQFRGGVRVSPGGHLIMNSYAVIERNIATSGGGVILMAAADPATAAQFTMNGGIIRNNAAIGTSNDGGGGVEMQTRGTFTMYGGNIQDNFSRQTGGGVRLLSNTRFTMYGGRIYKNTANSAGGGVRVSVTAGAAVPSVFNMHGGEIIGNDAGSFGGGVDVISGSVFTMLGPNAKAIAGNNAGWGGGGVSVTGMPGNAVSTFQINSGAHAVIEDNHAPEEGGGVFVFNHPNAIFNMYSGTIGSVNPQHSNSALRGGGVWVGEGADFVMSGGQIVGHNYSARGAAAPIHAGGGVWVCSPGTLFTMSGGIIGGLTDAHGNSAIVGGGVHVSDSAAFAMSDTAQVVRNKAVTVNDGIGGGIHVTGGAAFNMSGAAAVLYNTAENIDFDGGTGGIFVSDTGSQFTMDGGVVAYNYSYSTGGIQVSNSALFTMNNGYVRDNIARIAGAGIRVGQPPGGGPGGNFVMHNGYIIDNVLIGSGTAPSEGGLGVGVRIEINASFTMHNGNILRNNFISEAGIPASYGGGVFVNGGTFTMHDGRIAYNQIGMGSGVTVNQGLFTMLGGIIEENQADIGGGVFVAGGANSIVNMRGGQIRNNRHRPDHLPGLLPNRTILYGGGVFMSGTGFGAPAGGIFNMSGGIIGSRLGVDEGNHAQLGGGVWLGNGADFNMVQYNNNGNLTGGDGTIRDNLAEFSGGGVYVTGSTVMPGIMNATGGPAVATISHGTIGGDPELNEGNTAISGGGVWVGSGARLTIINEALISGNNTTDGDGGGVRVIGAYGLVPSTLYMTGGTIAYNRAVGVSLDALGNIADGSGGGVSVADNAIFEMYGGSVRNNEATWGSGGGVHALGSIVTMGESSIISTNEAGQNGGGVWIGANTTFDFHGGTVSYNQAEVNGGGFFVQGVNATLNMRGTAAKHITHNRAEYGGGVWVAANGQVRMPQTGGTNTSNVHITNNAATYDGGGIFTADYEYEAILSVDVSGDSIYYRNITILPGTTFTLNTAGNGAFFPPVNWPATDIPDNSRSVHAHPLNNYDINFRLNTVDFPFHKTNQHLYYNPQWNNQAWVDSILLPGAEFSLFRYNGPGSPSAELVTPVLVEAGTWTYVGSSVSTGLIGGPIVFQLLPGRYYHLVETSVPVGFQIPMGQWRINIADGFVISTTGGLPMPEFVYVPCNCESANCENEGVWFVGNWLQIILPLTGGEGSSMFLTTAGASVMGGAALLLLVLLCIKKKGKKSNDK